MGLPSSPDELPSLDRLHERHPGLTSAVNQAYAEAAEGCLARHHQPPIEVEIRWHAEGAASRRQLTWQQPGEREQAAWATVPQPNKTNPA